MKIAFAGGHHNSALVLAQALRSKHYDLLWLGHRYTMLGDKHDSLEYQEVTTAKIKFINLSAGKFHRAGLLHLLRLPLGFLQSFIALSRFQPDLVLCFGGYLSVPVALSALILRRPFCLFEQTMAVGRANKFLSRFSRFNFLTWPSSQKYFPQNSQVVGLPLHPDIFKAAKPAPQKTILITGGKQGSHVINQAVFSLLPELVQKYQVIHQVGASVKTGDFLQAQAFRHPAYQSVCHFSQKQMLQKLKTADLIITRAGAHITYELLVLGKPCIVIPLPFSYNHEQEEHARLLVNAGLGRLLPQDQLTPGRLLKLIRQPQLSKNTSHLVKLNATETILQKISTL